MTTAQELKNHSINSVADMLVKFDGARQRGEEANQHTYAERIFDMLLEDITIILHPKHRKCAHCGNEEDIFGACLAGDSIYFGSAADFCTKCDKPWGD